MLDHGHLGESGRVYLMHNGRLIEDFVVRSSLYPHEVVCKDSRVLFVIRNQVGPFLCFSIVLVMKVGCILVRRLLCWQVQGPLHFIDPLWRVL